MIDNTYDYRKNKEFLQDLYKEVKARENRIKNSTQYARLPKWGSNEKESIKDSSLKESCISLVKNPKIVLAVLFLSILSLFMYKFRRN